MKLALICLYAGGVLHIGWAGFHFFFPRIFKWQTALEPLDSLNRSIMQVLNLCLTFYFAVAAYLSLVYAQELLGTPLGRKLLAVFAAFWLLRLALQQRFFRMVHPASLLISVAFLLTMLTYGIPLVVAGR
jgi:glucan phosphoethanolaminetransferase (alkaline phosphatase superfamily)